MPQCMICDFGWLSSGLIEYKEIALLGLGA
jgi:hypothetical protein